LDSTYTHQLVFGVSRRSVELPTLENMASRVGAVALYTVLWTAVVKYRKWPFSAPHRTKTP
jgi:hypothetical protein